MERCRVQTGWRCSLRTEFDGFVFRGLEGDAVAAYGFRRRSVPDELNSLAGPGILHGASAPFLAVNDRPPHCAVTILAGDPERADGAQRAETRRQVGRPAGEETQHPVVALEEHLVDGQKAGDILNAAARFVVVVDEQVRIGAVVGFGPQPGEDGLRIVTHARRPDTRRKSRSCHRASAPWPRSCCG